MEPDRNDDEAGSGVSPRLLVINLSVHLLIAAPITPPEIDGIEPSPAGGRRGSGGLAMHGVMRALFARWVG
jgi:hypothetical protein